MSINWGVLPLGCTSESTCSCTVLHGLQQRLHGACRRPSHSTALPSRSSALLLGVSRSGASFCVLVAGACATLQRRQRC